MRAVSSEPSLLSHMRKMGLHTINSFSQCSDEPDCVCSLARAFTALAHTQNGRTYIQSMLRRDLICIQSCQSLHCSRTSKNGCVYGIFYQSMFKQALACVQSHLSLQCFRQCAKWAYIRYILSVNAQTRLSMHAVLAELSLRSHIHKMGMFMASFISQCSNKP